MNNDYALDLWKRALEALRTAEVDLTVSYDATASRSYYAAFFGVSALFAHEGVTFSKHSAVRAAVHRDLVKTGRWEVELGHLYDLLCELREIGDYGGGAHVSQKEAKDTLTAANRILQAARELIPDFPS